MFVVFYYFNFFFEFINVKVICLVYYLNEFVREDIYISFVLIVFYFNFIFLDKVRSIFRDLCVYEMSRDIRYNVSFGKSGVRNDFCRRFSKGGFGFESVVGCIG